MSFITLSRSYPSIFKASVIHSIDPAIFSYRYFTHCMSCTFCNDSCCSYGVDIDVENMARLKADTAFAESIGIPQDQWFEAEIEADHEFPGGAAGRTAVRDGACIFLDRTNRGCRIHRYCLETGIDYHQLKPIVSILFPLTFEQGVLTVSGEIQDGDLVCMNQGPVIYDGVRAELAYYFGEAFVSEVDALRPAL